MADGSCRFIKDSVNQVTWWGLRRQGWRRGREPRIVTDRSRSFRVPVVGSFDNQVIVSGPAKA